tara:strand:- start:14264 stop:14806 length:543 start_codon:yes stop_codon:yes gene_type:complete
MLNNMPSDKTKKLLEGLGKITDSSGVGPTKEEPKVHSFTNRFYTSISPSIHELPAKYKRAKKRKDEDGEEYVMIDRVYGSIFVGGARLLQADGSTYKGKLYTKRRLISNKDPMTRENKSFYSRCTVTADGRWFDNAGLPIEAPKNLEPEKVKSKEEVEEEQRIKAEKLKRKEAEILANLK